MDETDRKRHSFRACGRKLLLSALVLLLVLGAAGFGLYRFTDLSFYLLPPLRPSYRFRTAGQLLWAVLALVLPIFNGAAGILPLFFPNLCMKAGSILGILKP